MLEWIAKRQALFYQVSEVNVSRRKRGLYFLAEIFNGRIYSNVTVTTVTRKFANYWNYSNVDVSVVATALRKGNTMLCALINFTLTITPVQTWSANQ